MAYPHGGFEPRTSSFDFLLVEQYDGRMNWQSISPWIAPAVALSVVAYFTRLFGKVIADQKAFADNRDWEIELSGIMFLADFLLVPGIIAIGTLLHFKDSIMGGLAQIPIYISPVTYHWIDFIIIFLIGSYGTAAADILNRGKYDLPSINPEAEKNAVEKIFNRVTNINAVFLQMFSMIVISIFTLEIFSGNIFWISIFSVQVFLVLIIIALNYSLMRHFVPRVDIYFKEKTEPFRGVLLIKVNADNIKIRVSGKTSVLSKDEILRWEVLDEDQKKTKSPFMVPFIAWFPWLLALYLFWQNKFLLGILAAVGVAIIWIIFRIFFVPSSPKKVATDELEKMYGELPKSSIVISAIGVLFIIVSSVGALDS